MKQTQLVWHPISELPAENDINILVKVKTILCNPDNPEEKTEFYFYELGRYCGCSNCRGFEFKHADSIKEQSRHMSSRPIPIEWAHLLDIKQEEQSESS